LIFRASTSKAARAAQPQAADGGLRYSYKATLIGSARQFELRDDGLWWNVGGKSGLWSYRKIAAVRLSYRPVSMQSRRFRADIEDTMGERVTLYSTTWHTIALMSPQDEDYRAFIVELHRRLAAEKPDVVLVRGVNPNIYYAGLGLATLVGLAIAGLMVRGLLVGQFVAVLFLAGFAALFGWQIGGFLKRNAPGRYALNPLPPDLLP
jgi:hypothetical protein